MREFVHSLDRPVDLRQALSEQHIEFLKVNDTRLVVLYQGEVLQVTAVDGTTTHTREFHGRVWETPNSSTDDWEAYIERFIDILERATE